MFWCSSRFFSHSCISFQQAVILTFCFANFFLLCQSLNLRPNKNNLTLQPTPLRPTPSRSQQQNLITSHCPYSYGSALEKIGTSLAYGLKRIPILMSSGTIHPAPYKFQGRQPGSINNHLLGATNPWKERRTPDTQSFPNH